MEHLKESIRKKALAMVLGNVSMDINKRASNKAKINKRDYIKLKSFYTAKDAVQ